MKTQLYDLVILFRAPLLVYKSCGDGETGTKPVEKFMGQRKKFLARKLETKKNAKDPHHDSCIDPIRTLKRKNKILPYLFFNYILKHCSLASYKELG